LASTIRKLGKHALLPLLVLAISVVLARQLIEHRPQARLTPPPPPPAQPVEVQSLLPQSYQVRLRSFGTVQAPTRGQLVTQVSGQITWVDPQFSNGGFFEQDQPLLQIDDRDYRAALAIAEAELVNARLQLAEEQARAAQARRDWQRLGGGQAATELVLRKPQLAAAAAAVNSARAKLEQAELALQRTRIRAPYRGRILGKQVSLGQYVSAGTALAEIYAVDFLEVALPLNSSQQALVELPDPFAPAKAELGTQVILQVELGSRHYRWPATLVRSEAAVDANRQLLAIARIDAPYGPTHQDKPPLKIGQFVSAEIQGKRFEQVFVLPRASLYPPNDVLLFEDGRLRRQAVHTVWQNDKVVVVDQGLAAGQQLITTPLSNPISGTRVRLATTERNS